ncbi:MAG TPA: hypothetical protein VMF06_07930 [Candidatus Limnocylindria bacterium]|jgi:hypothetical protein|nr:hypothetical protein [Candidatus Limnocylindria bacterium]
MEVIHLALNHPLDLLGAIAIIASLLFAGVELKHSAKAHRVANLLSITQQHREIWSELYEQPELARVIDPKADLSDKPLTPQERLFVTFLVHHLSACFEATQAGMFQSTGALEQDIAQFFCLPIPATVWKELRSLQQDDFVGFVETSLGRSASATTPQFDTNKTPG